MGTVLITVHGYGSIWQPLQCLGTVPTLHLAELYYKLTVYGTSSIMSQKLQPRFICDQCILSLNIDHSEGVETEIINRADLWIAITLKCYKGVQREEAQVWRYWRMTTGCK